MKPKVGTIFWALLLIIAGALGLLSTMGIIQGENITLWMIIFAVVSLISLVFYFIGGVKNWPVLFPGTIFAALALLLFLADRSVDDPIIAAPLFVGIGIPFLVAFIIDRKNNWWAVIPLGVMLFLSLVVLVVDRIDGELIGSALFFILALVFFSIYLSRKAKWALLVAYIMFILGFAPLLATTSRADLFGPIFMLAVALPFAYVYLRDPVKRWWAIIPAGILATLAVVSAVVLLFDLPPALDTRLSGGITYFGIAATFFVVWMAHHQRWAGVIVILAGILLVLQVIFGNVANSWPVALILSGLYLLYLGLTRDKNKVEPAVEDHLPS